MNQGLLIFAARWPLPLWSAILLVAAYALGTEYLQTFVTSRTPEARDLVQNLAGLGTAVAVWLTGRSIERFGMYRSRRADRLFATGHENQVDGEPCDYYWENEHEEAEETCPTGY